MNKREKDIVQSILKAMKVTRSDVIDDFHDAISQYNHNGLPQAVWARRCDSLVESFKDFNSVEVLHITRTAIWQFDPVFDKKTGTLYVQFSHNNLESVRKKFIKEKDTSHYLFSLLFTVKEKSPLYGEEQHFNLFNDDNSEKIAEKRESDFKSLLGENGEFVKDVKVISVSYYDNEAITAKLIEYNDNFQLCGQSDISYLLSSEDFNVSETDTSTAVASLSKELKDTDEKEKKIVHLKAEYQKKENKDKDL